MIGKPSPFLDCSPVIPKRFESTPIPPWSCCILIAESKMICTS